MRAMLRTLRPFFISLFFTLSGLVVAAIVYSRQHPQASWILSAALPALLFEAVFYLASTFKQTREWFKKLLSHKLQAALMWISALLPYLIFSLGAHVFNRNSFYLYSCLTAIFCFWYVLVPRRLAYDLGFLIIAAAPQITGVFKRLFVLKQADIIGHLAWIHIGILALLILREWKPGEFSLWPNSREWQIGMLTFFISIAPLIGLAQTVHFARFVAPNGAWWRIAGEGLATFFGIIWVVALSEELFFRGFIQNALQNKWNPIVAVLASAPIFGAAHLWVRTFPNWPYMAVASLLGVACGIAYWWAGSVRASMVTHAMVVVTWRLFFQLR